MKLGAKYRLHRPLKPGTATVVDMLPARVTPSREDVMEYYQFSEEDAKDNPDAFRAGTYNRWILKRDNGSFIVLPDLPDNVALVEKL